MGLKDYDQMGPGDDIMSMFRPDGGKRAHEYNEHENSMRTLHVLAIICGIILAIGGAVGQLL